MTTNHAPRSWHVTSDGLAIMLGYTYIESGAPGHPLNPADARLIAAAPDMLAALRSAEGELVAAYGAAGHELDHARKLPAVRAIRAAIAAATGGA